MHLIHLACLFYVFWDFDFWCLLVLVWNLSGDFWKKILFNIVIHSVMISQKLNECILKHTVIKLLCYKSTKDILYKVFALSNATHRNTITEAHYFITHINKKTNAKIIQTKKPMPKSYKMRYHCHVLADLNKHETKAL